MASGYVIASPTGDPLVLLAQEFGTGRAASLGKYSLVAEERIHLDTLDVTSGSFALTAADGDAIHGTYSGRAAREGPAGVIRIQASGLVTGGTGRFAGATGRLAFARTMDLAAGEFSETVDIEHIEEARGEGR